MHTHIKNKIEENEKLKDRCEKIKKKVKNKLKKYDKKVGVK